MGEKTKKRKKFMRICALVVVGMFVLMTSMSVPADDVDDWTRWGDNADPTWVLGTLNPQDLRIITAGSQKMVVTTSGQVGIGTPGPISMLEVRGSGISPATSAFRVNDGLDTGLFFVRDDGNIGIGTLNPICTLHIKELTPGAETIMALESESPSIIPGDHLGTIMFMGPHSGSVGAMIRAEATGAFVDVDPNVSPTGLQFYTQDATSGTGLLAPRMIIDMNGNVGIGTTDPDNKLHIFADSAGAASSHHSAFLTIENSAWAYMQFLTPNTGFQGILFGDTESSEAGYIEYCHGENSMRFNVNGDRAIFIDNQRRVGIGTTSPDEELHVVGNIKMVDGNQGAGKVLTSDANGVGTWQEPQVGIGGSGTTNYIPKFIDSTTLGNSIIYESPSGKVGIGTTNPGANLDSFDITNLIFDVDGQMVVTGNNHGESIYFRNSGYVLGDSTGYFRLSDKDAGRIFEVVGRSDFFFDNVHVYPDDDNTLKLGKSTNRWKEVHAVKGFFSNNVGIGTTTPSSTLDVNGDIEIGSDNEFYFGDPDTDGSWRITRSGNSLVFQIRESGSWVTKLGIS